MNKERRAKIKTNNKRLDLVTDLLNTYKSELESIQMDEEFAFDNLPEGFQNGLKGDEMQEAIDEMEDSMEAIDDIIKELENIKSNLSIL